MTKYLVAMGVLVLLSVRGSAQVKHPTNIPSGSKTVYPELSKLPGMHTLKLPDLFYGYDAASKAAEDATDYIRKHGCRPNGVTMGIAGYGSSVLRYRVGVIYEVRAAKPHKK